MLTVLLAISAGYWDATIATWLPGTFQGITFGLPLVLVLAAYSSEERAITAALVSGVVLDVLLPANSSLVSIRFVAIAALIHLLAKNILTNRSLIGAYTMGGIAVCMNRLMLMGFEGFFRLVGRSVIPEAHAPLTAELLWMGLCMTTVFLAFAAFSRRFLPLISRQESERLPLWRT